MKKKVHPQKVGPYILLSPIGRGGMSVVYRALEPDQEKIVALKLLFPLQPMTDLVGLEKLRNIFTAEAEKMADLHHPHIVKVLDLELDGRTPYFTMEYHCTNIGTMINENFILEDTTRIITPEKVLDYTTQVLDGLRYIHDAGIIHRDIKPHNILVADTDSAKICDFGTALQEDEEAFDTTGLKVGSPYYIAPEQEKDPVNADQRSDLYSVAVMLYRMLTGELPDVKTFSLNRINSPGDKNWIVFFRKALAQDPALRFQNTQEMTAALMELGLLLENELDSTCRDIRPEKSDAGQSVKKIRCSPIRAAGTNARQTFQVNELWQPKQYVENTFADQTENTVTDSATGLIWQRKDSGEPLNHVDADSFIESQNDTQKFGISSWRLPTVNELLTLVNDPHFPESRCPKHVWQKMKQWYWSCDLRSEKTSWYVNISLGYAGWQDNSCRNYVRAVASLAAE